MSAKNKICMLLFTGLSTVTILSAQLSPQEAIGIMGRGINMGNTLDARNYEGEWGNVAQEYLFDEYAAAGFTNVRIPVTWNMHTDTLPPYTIDTTFLDRVEEVADWALNRNLIVVINAHHEEWIKEEPTAEHFTRFDSIWSQISHRFKDKSDSLLFEMINEPYPMAEELVDSLNRRILATIRKENPTRIVLFSGYMWSNSWELISIPIPEDDYLIGYFHSYDPWSFAGEGEGTWGTAADINSHKAKFQAVQDWSVTNNIPVYLGEFGSRQDLCDFNSSMRHYAFYVEESLRHGWAFAVWDDNGWFRVLNRSERTWRPSKDILVNNSIYNPGSLILTNHNGDSVTLGWNNRTTGNDSIIVQRGTSATTLTDFASLPFDVHTYTDTSVERNRDYYYRIVARFIDSTDLYSYPQMIASDYVSALFNLESNNFFTLSPNPATDYIMIQNYTDKEYIDRITVYDLNGNRITERRMHEKSPRVNTDLLLPGTYILEFMTEKTVYRKQFIKY